MKNRIIYNWYWKLIGFLWFFIYKTKKANRLQRKFSFGIVTYADRYDTFFKSLIRCLVFCFPDTEIVVVINGYYDLEKQKKYLLKINQFLVNFPHIKIICFEKPQSLSKLWNLAIINSTNDKVFIMNDDLKISPWFHVELTKSNILTEDIALINRSWSHFLISKKTIKDVGYFDERFPALGNEDEDYEARLTFDNIELRSYKIRQIFNVVEQPKSYSYGENIELVHVKYAKANQDFFNLKWDKVKTAKTGYCYVPILNAYLKLKDGMETPNFYEK